MKSMLRVIYGQKLEYRLKHDFNLPISETNDWNMYSQAIRSLDALNKINENIIPFIEFSFKEGSGWIPITYNTKGWELYGDSIMGDDNVRAEI